MEFSFSSKNPITNPNLAFCHVTITLGTFLDNFHHPVLYKKTFWSLESVSVLRQKFNNLVPINTASLDFILLCFVYRYFCLLEIEF
jgi:uncharacterized membrane protein YwzB